MAFIQKIKGKKGPIYKVHYSEPVTGQRRCKSFDRRKDADAFRDSPKVTARTVTPSNTISDIVTHWLDVCENVGRNGREPVARATLRQYERHARIISEAIISVDGAQLKLGTVLMSRLDKHVCEAFRSHLVKEFSWVYARKILTSFKSVLEQARASDLMDHMPAEHIFIRPSRRNYAASLSVTDKAPSIAEIHKILQSLRERLRVSDRTLRRRRRRYKLILETLAFGGTRPGEALGLPWSQVDFEKGGINIIQDIEEDGSIGKPKSAASYRFIVMPDCYMSQLRHWRKLCPESDFDLVFPNWSGKAEFVSNLNRRGWRPVLIEAEIVTDAGKPKYSPKSLRHARASLEIESGANPKEIQKLMGHSSIQVTYDVYGHLFEAHDERRAIRANAIAHMLTHTNPDQHVTDL